MEGLWAEQTWRGRTAASHPWGSRSQERDAGAGTGGSQGSRLLLALDLFTFSGGKCLAGKGAKAEELSSAAGGTQV